MSTGIDCDIELGDNDIGICDISTPIPLNHYFCILFSSKPFFIRVWCLLFEQLVYAKKWIYIYTNSKISISVQVRVAKIQEKSKYTLIYMKNALLISDSSDFTVASYWTIGPLNHFEQRFLNCYTTHSVALALVVAWLASSSTLALPSTIFVKDVYANH